MKTRKEAGYTWFNRDVLAFWQGSFSKSGWQWLLLIYIATNVFLLMVHLIWIDWLAFLLPWLGSISWGLSLLVMIGILQNNKGYSLAMLTTGLIMYVLSALEGFFSWYLVSSDHWTNWLLSLLPALVIALIPIAIGTSKPSVYVFSAVFATFSVIDALLLMNWFYSAGIIGWVQVTFIIVLGIIVAWELVKNAAKLVLKREKAPIPAQEVLSAFSSKNLNLGFGALGILGTIGLLGDLIPAIPIIWIEWWGAIILLSSLVLISIFSFEIVTSRQTRH